VWERGFSELSLACPREPELIFVVLVVIKFSKSCSVA
jgi:hypothetical protein